MNQHLLTDLTDRNLWNDNVKNLLVANNGSVQNIDCIPDDIKLLYKTVWEISQKTIIKMAAGRAPFIDQSQSLNIHMAEPSYAKLSSMHFYCWKMGLKTGMYYLRSKPAVNAIQFTVDKTKLSQKGNVGSKDVVVNGMKGELENGGMEEITANMDAMMCSLKNKEACLMCSG